MIPLDKSHSCLFLSDTFREKLLIRSRLMHLFLFSDKTCLIPITDALPALSTDSVNTTSLFVDGSRQPTHLFINVTFSHQSMYHVASVFSSSSFCFVWEFWNQKTPIIFFTWKFIYTFSDILSLDLQRSVLHRFVLSTQNKDLQCLVISATYSLGKSLFI